MVKANSQSSSSAAGGSGVRTGLASGPEAVGLLSLGFMVMNKSNRNKRKGGLGLNSLKTKPTLGAVGVESNVIDE